MKLSSLGVLSPSARRHVVEMARGTQSRYHKTRTIRTKSTPLHLDYSHSLNYDNLLTLRLSTNVSFINSVTDQTPKYRHDSSTWRLNTRHYEQSGRKTSRCSGGRIVVTSSTETSLEAYHLYLLPQRSVGSWAERSSQKTQIAELLSLLVTMSLLSRFSA